MRPVKFMGREVRITAKQRDILKIFSKSRRPIVIPWTEHPERTINALIRHGFVDPETYEITEMGHEFAAVLVGAQNVGA